MSIIDALICIFIILLQLLIYIAYYLNINNITYNDKG